MKKIKRFGELFEDETPESKEKKGFSSNIEEDTKSNEDYRKVIYTGEHSQLVLMSLKPGEEIGEEVHKTIDQFFRIESGNGKCIINGNEYSITDGSAIIVPAGSKHNIINIDEKNDLKLYSIYSPPKHKDGLVQPTKDTKIEDDKFEGTTE